MTGFPGQGIQPRIWEKVQLARPGGTRFDAHLIGYIRGVSLLVTLPVHDGLRMDFLEGERVEVRMFTGSEIHVFETHVSQLCVAPVHYLHLAYPQEMRIQPLRRNPWVDVQIPANLIMGDSGRVPVLIENLSEGGARVAASEEVKEDRFSISFVSSIDDLKREIILPAEVVHRELRRGRMHECGVSFGDLGETEKLWLKCLVLRTMLESG